MRKEGLVFIITLLFFSIGAFGETSNDNDVEISIEGCSDGAKFAKIGECLDNTYCASHDTLLDSFTEPNACTKNNPYVVGNIYSGEVCCSGGFSGCKVEDRDTGDGDAYYCVAAVKNCEDFDSKELCNGSVTDGALLGQCYWNANVGSGVCIPFSQGCYDYNDSVSCTNDVQGVARNDPNCKYGEFIVGGFPYIVSRDTCRCEWRAEGSSPEKCVLKYNVTSAYGAGNDNSICTFSLKIEERCEDGDIGFEKYLYVADYNKSTMDDDLFPSDVGCSNRSGQRRCGVPVVKVPFFNFVNVILAVLFIFMIYSFRSKFSFWYE